MGSRHVSWPAGSTAAFLAAALIAAPVYGHGGQASLGAVDFRASCSEPVRDDFDRAVGLLHHMMYVEARRAFDQITEREAECAMAHWGIAMTLFQPLWPTRPSFADLQRGWEAVQRAKELRPASERDRALLAATEAFYREPQAADWWTRIRRWGEGMERAFEAHADDREVAAFYALSQLAVGQVADDRTAYHARAGEILAAIHRQEPTHPGAIHYTIHTNDVDTRAHESLDVVRSYSGIAPEVPHALHMPTHIFVRLGEWPEVIAWNRRSANAALEFPAGANVSHHYLHAIDYLAYAFLQLGEDDEAAAVITEAFAKQGYQPSFVSAFHLAAMPARYAVERRQWREAAALKARDFAGIPWEKFAWPEAMSWFARGLGLVHGGDVDAAAAAEREMQRLRDRATSAGEDGFARYIEIDRLILAGRIAQARGQSGEAERLMRSATALEATVQKHPVTPGSVLPSSEALGDLLLELERPRDALAAYQASLRIWPGRFNSLLGCGRAAEAAGKTQEATACYSDLLKVSGQSTRPELTEAERFVSAKG